MTTSIGPDQFDPIRAQELLRVLGDAAKRAVKKTPKIRHSEDIATRALEKLTPTPRLVISILNDVLAGINQRYAEQLEEGFDVVHSDRDGVAHKSTSTGISDFGRWSFLEKKDAQDILSQKLRKDFKVKREHMMWVINPPEKQDTVLAFVDFDRVQVSSRSGVILDAFGVKFESQGVVVNGMVLEEYDELILKLNDPRFKELLQVAANENRIVSGTRREASWLIS